MKKFGILTALVLVNGCTNVPEEPSIAYNILDPFQVSTDYLLNTRHYKVEQGRAKFNYRENLLFQKSNTASVYRNSDWEQLFIKLENTPNEAEIARRFSLDDSLARTCWANRDDAKVEVQSNGMRAAVKPNYINACVSSDLGSNYPLFAYSWLDDPVLGQYLMVIKPAKHYNDTDYLRKLKAEGYHFDMHLYCRK